MRLHLLFPNIQRCIIYVDIILTYIIVHLPNVNPFSVLMEQLLKPTPVLDCASCQTRRARPLTSMQPDRLSRHTDMTHHSRNIIFRLSITSDDGSSGVHGHSIMHATRHFLEAQCAFKVLMIPKSCNSHYVSHFAASFIVMGA